MIYYDITDLIDYFRKYPRVSGIQRVSIATIAHFQDLGVGREVKLVAFHPKVRRFVQCELKDFPIHATSGVALSACFGIQYKGPHPLDDYLRARYKTNIARFFHKWRLCTSNALTRGKTFRRKCVSEGDARRLARQIQWQPIELSKRDVVFVSGGLSLKVLAKLAEARRKTGARHIQLVHDVLPISHPQFVLQGHALIFAEWLMAVTNSADYVITTSKWNETALNAEIRQRKKTPPSIIVVPLAHEFLESAEDRAKPLYERVSTPVLAVARLPFVLCVGTREIRKNNLGLAQAWQRLEKKFGPSLPRLLFAGRDGWMNDDFDHFMRRTDAANDSIKLLTAPTEQELAYLYKNCLFSVYPSFCEGWGLPIGESLWFGRPVIASKLTAMPEVAGEFADYVDPYDFESVVAAIERMLDHRHRQSREEAIKTMKMRLWDDFADDLLGVLRQTHI